MDAKMYSLLLSIFGILCCCFSLASCECRHANGTACTKGPWTKGDRLTAERASDALFTAVFWEVKPYAFRNGNKTEGFYPQIFENAASMCLNRNSENHKLLAQYNASKIIDFKVFRQTSRRNFLKIFKANEYPLGLVPGRDVYFPPIYQRNKAMRDLEKQKLFMNFDITQASHLAILARRDHISLPYKIARGIQSCGQIFFMAFLMTIFFGLLMWISERVNNPAFPDSCFMGTGTGVWWSFVSMTTVGYGDVVPNSIIGRGIAVIWVCIGVMIACIVTATVAEVVNGDDFDIAGKKIAVIEDSIEASRLASDFRAIPYGVPTYEAVYDAVRNGDVIGGAVNADIAAWAIDSIQDDTMKNPLRVIKLMPTRIDLGMVFSYRIPNDFKPIIRCMHKFNEEVYNRAKAKYGRYCPTETLYIESFGDMFKSDFVRVMLGLIFALCIVGAVLDLMNRRKLKQQKENGIDGNHSESEAMIVMQDSNNGSTYRPLEKKDAMAV